MIPDTMIPAAWNSFDMFRSFSIPMGARHIAPFSWETNKKRERRMSHLHFKALPHVFDQSGVSVAWEAIRILRIIRRENEHTLSDWLTNTIWDGGSIATQYHLHTEPLYQLKRRTFQKNSMKDDCGCSVWLRSQFINWPPTTHAQCEHWLIRCGAVRHSELIFVGSFTLLSMIRNAASSHSEGTATTQVCGRYLLCRFEIFKGNRGFVGKKNSLKVAAPA